MPLPPEHSSRLCGVIRLGVGGSGRDRPLRADGATSDTAPELLLKGDLLLLRGDLLLSKVDLLLLKGDLLLLKVDM